MGLIERGVLFQLFWAPAVVSAGLLLVLWTLDALPKHTPAFVGWFLLAVILQFSAASPGTWVFGLILQTALAIVLLLRVQLERI